MNTITRPVLYPMSIGSHQHGPVMQVLIMETPRGPIMANMAHFIRAEMSGNSLFLRFADTPAIKVPGANLDMLEIAVKRFK